MRLANKIGAFVWISAAAAFMPSAGAQPAPPARTVYYQVTHANGQIHQADKVPRTNKNIRTVIRVVRLASAGPGSVIVSTGPMPVVEVNPGETIEQVLTWNGKAWVGPPPAARPPGPKPVARKASAADVVEAETRRLGTILKVLKARLKDLDHSVAEANRKLAAARTKAGKKSARDLLAKAALRRDDYVKAIGQYRRQLDALKGPAAEKGAVVPASGGVRLADAPPKNAAGAPAKPIGSSDVPDHRVQVWKLAPGKGARTYEMSMAHPEGGSYGAFYYVAYADTDGDGRPDKLIARSPLAAARTPGQWSTWRFRTSHPIVFIGNAWTGPHTQVYRRGYPPGTVPADLPAEVYVGPIWGRGGFRRSRWAFQTNLRYRVVIPPQQLDEQPSPSTGSGIYE